MDKITFRILLITLGVFEVILLVGAFVLQYNSKEIPDFVVAAIPSVLTGMLGLAIRTNNEVPVVQNNGNPAVPVVPAEGA